MFNFDGLETIYGMIWFVMLIIIIIIFLLSFRLMQLSTTVNTILKLQNVILEFKVPVCPYCISCKNSGVLVALTGNRSAELRCFQKQMCFGTIQL